MTGPPAKESRPAQTGAPVEQPLVHVLLPVHNRCEVTRRFIACYNAQTYPRRHLVLIDDGSTDGTREMVSAAVADLTVITGNGDWWWAGALQQGYKWLRAQGTAPDDIVLIINDDTEFNADFLELAVGLLQGSRHSLLMAEAFDRSSGACIGRGVHVDWRQLRFSPAPTPDQINCLETCGLFLFYEDFSTIGGFFPRLLPQYLSDYEFTIRAHRKGLRLWTDRSLRLWVDTSTTGLHHFDRESFSCFCREYFAKNSDANPFYWTAFVALACPWLWKPTGWMRVWYGTARKLLSALVHSLRNH